MTSNERAADAWARREMASARTVLSVRATPLCAARQAAYRACGSPATLGAILDGVLNPRVSVWGIPFRTQQVSWMLFVALLPTLLFFGHRPDVHVSLRGSGLTLTAPFIGHSRGGAEVTDTESGGTVAHHDQHCHANVGSCSDVPFTGISAFALLSESVSCIGRAGALVGLECSSWQPTAEATVPPRLRPPRT